MAIIRNHLRVVPLASKPDKTWQQIAMERMGIKPGIYNECGGNMIIVDSMPNQFRERKRAPPNLAG